MTITTGRVEGVQEAWTQDMSRENKKLCWLDSRERSCTLGSREGDQTMGVRRKRASSDSRGSRWSHDRQKYTKQS